MEGTSQHTHTHNESSWMEAITTTKKVENDEEQEVKNKKNTPKQ